MSVEAQRNGISGLFLALWLQRASFLRRISSPNVRVERRSSRLFLLIDSSVAQHADVSCLLRALISRVIFIQLNLEEWDWMNLKLCHKCCAQRRAPSVNRKTMTPLVEIAIHYVCDMCLCIGEEKVWLCDNIKLVGCFRRVGKAVKSAGCWVVHCLPPIPQRQYN